MSAGLAIFVELFPFVESTFWRIISGVFVRLVFGSVLDHWTGETNVDMGIIFGPGFGKPRVYNPSLYWIKDLKDGWNSQKVKGIFGTWDLKFWTSPEEEFRHKLENNPFHPFTEVSPDHFEMSIRSPWLWIYSASLLVTIFTTVGYYARNPLDQFLTYFVMAFVGLMYATFVHADVRRFVINSARSEYEFHTGNRLAYRGHIHNVYIRLVGQKSGAGDTYYKIVLNGFHLEEQALTSSTIKRHKLERLGRKLAARLNVNYFDFVDKSVKHIIRHRCPYASPEESVENLSYMA